MRLSRKNTARAFEIIEASGVMRAWESVGAEPRLVGSLRMGLLMKHKDIDIHIYSDELSVEKSFAAVSSLAANPSFGRIEYTNLAHTEEECLEWHAWYTGSGGEVWQFDMIHILRGSFFDGYCEKVADRVTGLLTPRQRETVLRLKYETPSDEKIPGISYYRGVLEGGVSGYEEFIRWTRTNAGDGTQLWMP